VSGISNYGAFLLAGVLLNLTPGNDTIYILSQSMARGKRAGIFSALGIGTGSIIHTLLAAFGLSLILSQSIVLFTAVKYLGAAYLVFVGISMFLDRSGVTTEVVQKSVAPGYAKTYRDAVLTNLFNPKVALFFIAFLPQFIDSSYKHTVIPFLTLGFTFTFTGTLWCMVLASFSADLTARLRARRGITSILNKISGTVLVGLGVKLALIRAK